MKIFCIGRNYAAHIKEFDNKFPDEPVFFLKPDSALILNNKPFFLPDFSNDMQHEVEIVLKINRVGKHIDRKFAHRYYQEIGIGIDFTARDLQRKQMVAGNPWEIAKAFDGAAPLGRFVKKELLPPVDNLNFRLELNQKVVQQGNTRDLIFSFDVIIEHLSRFFTLKIGDLIYTGTPSGVGPVMQGDRLTAFLEEMPLLDFEVK